MKVLCFKVVQTRKCNSEDFFCFWCISESKLPVRNRFANVIV